MIPSISDLFITSKVLGHAFLDEISLRIDQIHQFVCERFFKNEEIEVPFASTVTSSPVTLNTIPSAVSSTDYFSVAPHHTLSFVKLIEQQMKNPKHWENFLNEIELDMQDPLESMLWLTAISQEELIALAAQVRTFNSAGTESQPIMETLEDVLNTQIGANRNFPHYDFSDEEF